jgi:hypothetical protein
LAERTAVDERPDLLIELGLAEASAAMPEAVEHLAAAHTLALGQIDGARIAAELAVTLEHQGRPQRP